MDRLAATATVRTLAFGEVSGNGARLSSSVDVQIFAELSVQSTARTADRILADNSDAVARCFANLRTRDTLDSIGRAL